MNLKLFNSQLQNEDMSQFSYLKKQIEYLADNCNREIALKIQVSIYCKTHLKLLQDCVI